MVDFYTQITDVFHYLFAQSTILHSADPSTHKKKLASKQKWSFFSKFILGSLIFKKYPYPTKKKSSTKDAGVCYTTVGESRSDCHCNHDEFVCSNCSFAKYYLKMHFRKTIVDQVGKKRMWNRYSFCIISLCIDNPHISQTTSKYNL